MNSMNGMKRKRKLLNELKPKSEQLACIKEAQSMYKDIYEGFKNQERKTFLIEEDFQEERKNKSYVDNMTNSYIDFKESKYIPFLHVSYKKNGVLSSYALLINHKAASSGFILG